MKIQESYIQYLSGYNKENISLLDIEKALVDIQKMDEEHGAFWVSVFTTGENVLEVSKDKVVIGIFEPDQENDRKIQAESWDEVKQLYIHLLNGELIALKKKFI